MFRRAPLALLTFAALLVAEPLAAQSNEQNPGQSKSAEEQQAETREQAALGLLDQVVAGVKGLNLPQNRIVIESEALPLAWQRSESRGRALVSQIIGEFAQAATQIERGTDLNLAQGMRQQRQMLVQTIAPLDAQLALEFLGATRPYAPAATPEEEEAEERRLRLNLDVQEATRNPRHALEMAQKDIEAPGDLPYELISLLNQVTAGDQPAGAQLFRDIVGQVKNRHLALNQQDFNFAINLLNTRNGVANEAKEADGALHALADAIASAALSPQFSQNLVPTLDGALPALQQLVPAKVHSLQPKVDAYEQTVSPEQKTWNAFNQAQSTGNREQLLAVAAQAPSNIRSSLYTQIASISASNGDYEQARQLSENVTDPAQRNQILQQALQQAVWAANNSGDFASARQYAERVLPETDRATLLAQVAVNALNGKQPVLAEQILQEAMSLVGSRAQSLLEFSAQLQVAQISMQMKSGSAMQMLERAANQLEQVLSAALQVDGFLPYQHAFEDGELLLTNGFFYNSLIRPYVQATAILANSDFLLARTLADRLPLPEARLMADLAVARSVLGQGGTVATSRTARRYNSF